MSDPIASAPNGARVCPRCGQSFICGLSAHQEKCWCFAHPHVISIKDASRQGCLCPTCLAKQIAEIQAKGQASAG